MKKKLILILTVCAMVLGMLSGCAEEEKKTLKVYVDGRGIANFSVLVSEFQRDHPEILVDIEMLPEVRVGMDENMMPVVDTDSLMEREAVLQQHRTALMAQSSDADLYILTGGVSQFHELNGGALVQDPADLMRNGVLSDLSGVLELVDAGDYMTPAFEAGTVDGKLYLVPLRVSVSGILIREDEGLENLTDRDELFQALTGPYAGQLGNIAQIPVCWQGAMALSAVDAASGTIALDQPEYTQCFEQMQQLQELVTQAVPVGDLSQALARGDSLLQYATNPCSSLITMDFAALENTELRYVPVPNELGGNTVEVGVYALAPKGSEQQEAAAELLAWLLSEKVQDDTVQVFSNMYYPVKKGCLENSLRHYREELPELVGQKFLVDVAGMEQNVTHAKYSSRYEFELMTVVNQWQAGEVELMPELTRLTEQWRRYLDE